MCDDRTSEFLSMARSLPQERLQARPMSITSQGRSQGGVVAVASSATGRYGAYGASASSNPVYDELRVFHKTAADISKDIAKTSHMLSELTQLVRSKSLFVDDSDRVNTLVLSIKSSIENLNGRLDEAATVIAQQKRQLGRNSQAGQEASNLVGQLKEEFVQATAGFKKVLQLRTDAIKETSDRKRQVYGGTGPQQDFVTLSNKPIVYDAAPQQQQQQLTQYQNQPSSSLILSRPAANFPTIDLTSAIMSAGEPTSSASQLPRPHGVAGDGQYGTPGMRLRKSASDLPPYSSAYHGTMTPLTPLDIQRMEQESGQDQLMQLIPDQDYLRERADAMETVESNIVELGTIFTKLAAMVSEHREMVQRVEDNVDDANTNINLAMGVLTDTLTSLRTNKALFTKVFSVIAIFIILFIIFFA